MLKKRFLCSTDECFVLESITKTGKINVPSFLLVEEDTAKETDFDLVYANYLEIKNGEEISFVFDLYFEKN